MFHIHQFYRFSIKYNIISFHHIYLKVAELTLYIFVVFYSFGLFGHMSSITYSLSPDSLFNIRVSCN